MTNHTPTGDEIARQQARGAFNRWLADHDRHVKAEAWDEGYGDCWAYHGSHGLTGREDNPYRQEQPR